MADLYTGNLFDGTGEHPGAMGCRLEIAATMREALEKARDSGLTRERVAERMGYYLGERLSVDTLNGLVAPSHTDDTKTAAPRDIKYMWAMAFDAAVDQDALMGLFAAKRGGRMVLGSGDAALLEWARLHQAEKEAREQRRALEAVLYRRGK